MANVVLSLPYPISANRYWRPVNLGKHISIVPTTEAKNFKKHVAMIARVAGVHTPLDGRVWLRIRLYPHRPQDWLKRAQKNPDTWDDSVQCMDVGNCEKVLCDALNGVAWHDDKQIRVMILERMVPDEHGARCIVEFHQIEVERTAQVWLL